MNYSDYEIAFSRARLGKYLIASNGDSENAMILYRCNISLCQKFYPLLNVFEVVLRNAINAHYKRVFSDSDWIRHQLAPNGMLENHPHKNAVERIIRNLDDKGFYSSDKVVSSMTLGFWIHLFSRRPFALGGQSILRVFPQRDKGLGQRVIYNELKTLKTFRNRIAHHEAICFDPRGVKSSAQALANYLLLTKYARFLGYDEALLFDRLDTNPYCLLKEIDNL
ncbi:MAG: Abi family protein [Bacteroidales bacterium]|nr:Abi family protein [Bacteroidales bacterium]